MTKRRVFVDTSAWANIVNKRSPSHEQAAETYSRLLAENATLIVTGFVLAETHVLLHRKLGYPVAQEFLRAANTSSHIQIIYPGSSTEKAAKLILEKYTDQDFSLTDAISFAVMQEVGVAEAFSYDAHFITAGFVLVNPLPEP